jgi:16S rRNA (cytosine967-C5)-methyltransferase
LAKVVTTALFSPPDPPHHPALLTKAAGEGRIRGTALEIYATLRADPTRADLILPRALRAARHLHSRERRFVADALYGLIRYHTLLAHIIGTDTNHELWRAWLGWQGLPDAPIDIATHVNKIQKDNTPIAALSLIGGLDSHISEALVNSLGDTVWPFLWASNTRASMTLRTNPFRAPREAVQRALAKQGIETTPLSTPYGLKVCAPANLKGQKSFQNGWFEVQDEGSQHLAALCGPTTGTVIDYCAGAGGKTLAIAASAPDCTLIAADVRAGALTQLEKRARRAGLKRLQVHHLTPDSPLNATAETVFVDAPCSGLGTLRRHPELRLRLTEASLDEVLALQQEVLHRASLCVAPGGRLIYGTCSVLREENEGAVERFLGEHGGFSLTQEPPLNRAPHTHQTDGFFGAVMVRNQMPSASAS